MIDQGILNRQLGELLLCMGHTDTLMICDAGMPLPSGVPVVDLALCEGVPEVYKVLGVILSQFTVEQYVVASELSKTNPMYSANLERLLNGHAYRPQRQEVSHQQLKEMSKACKCIVRTGDFHAYANVILSSASSDRFITGK